MRIDTKSISKWNTAKKTLPIKVKPLVNLITDKLIINKFLLNTLEGNETLEDGSIICMGDAGDMWQQSSSKLLDKYIVTAIDNDGWMVCTPKPDNAVNVIEVDDKMVGENGEFTIVGHWGEIIAGVKNVQKGTVGDFILQNKNDCTDVWIVKRKRFLSTYQYCINILMYNIK